MAEDCLLAQPIERLLWRKRTLRIEFSGAATDPQRTLDGIISKAGNTQLGRSMR
jgi:hypothetical protein